VKFRECLVAASVTLTGSAVVFYHKTFEIRYRNRFPNERGTLKTKTMSDQITQASELGIVNALSSDQIKVPTQPVDVYIQESENLIKWCTPDKTILLAKGLNPYYFDAMPFALAICRDAQATWAAEQKIKSDAAKAWQEQSPAAFTLRNQLLADFRYAFRNDTDLLKSVALIAEGSSNADMIQDLADLAALGNKNPAPLAAINFPNRSLGYATTLSTSLAVVLAEANGDKNSENATLLFRNKAYTHLKTAVDEIKACGKYAFRGDKARLKGYKSAFWRKKYMNRAKAEKKEKTQVEQSKN
jgi:hypothetical protein